MERETYNVPRHLKTPPPGTRPAPLAEVAGPQEGAVTDGYVAAPVPLVSSPMLAGGDATDDVTVAFLVGAVFEEKRLEEEMARVRRQREAAEHEARMRELDRRVQDDVPLSSTESRAWMRWAGHLPPKRKRKKKRKRKPPRNSSHPRLAARHLGRYGPERHLCRDTETASVARAVRTWKSGLSSIHWYLAPCSVPVTPEEHRTIWSFLGVHYAELFLWPLVSGSHLCGVFYDPLSKSFWFFWKMTSCISVCSTPWFDSGYVLGVSFQRPGPEPQITVDSPQLQFIAGRRHLDMQRQIPMVQTVQQTTEIPQMPFVFKCRCPCCAGRACHTRCCQRQVRKAQTLQKTVEVPQLQFIKVVFNSCRYAEADPMVSETKEIPQFFDKVVDVPVVQVVRFHRSFISPSLRRGSSMVQTVRRTMGGFSLTDDFRIVSVLSAELGSTSDTCAASVSEAFWKNFTLFLVVFLWEMTSCLSPCSALSLVRQRIHALHKSTELFEEAHIFST